MIKAIETEYRGYRFRSRLEARWAVFFDALGVEWEYEPEGFDLGDGLYYLPDFQVKCWGYRGNISDVPSDLWIEVKGVMSPKDAEKIRRFVNLREEVTEDGRCPFKVDNPVLIVNKIPEKGCSHDIECYDDMNGTGICPFNYELIDGDYFGAFPAAANGKFFLWGHDSNYVWNVDEVETAYDKARQARFEHGEAGA